MSLSSSPGSRAEYAHIGTANRCVLPPPCCIAAAQCRRLRRGDHALLTSRCAFPAQPVARSPSSATFGAVLSSASSAVRNPGTCANVARQDCRVAVPAHSLLVLTDEMRLLLHRVPLSCQNTFLNHPQHPGSPHHLYNFGACPSGLLLPTVSAVLIYDCYYYLSHLSQVRDGRSTPAAEKTFRGDNLYSPAFSARCRTHAPIHHGRLESNPTPAVPVSCGAYVGTGTGSIPLFLCCCAFRYSDPNPAGPSRSQG